MTSEVAVEEDSSDVEGSEECVVVSEGVELKLGVDVDEDDVQSVL